MPDDDREAVRLAHQQFFQHGSINHCATRGEQRRAADHCQQSGEHQVGQRAAEHAQDGGQQRGPIHLGHIHLPEEQHPRDGCHPQQRGDHEEDQQQANKQHHNQAREEQCGAGLPAHQPELDRSIGVVEGHDHRSANGVYEAADPAIEGQPVDQVAFQAAVRGLVAVDDLGVLYKDKACQQQAEPTQTNPKGRVGKRFAGFDEDLAQEHGYSGRMMLALRVSGSPSIIIGAIESETKNSVITIMVIVMVFLLRKASR